MSGSIVCYLLITYGEKPSKAVRDHPAARAQVRFFDQALKSFSQVEPMFRFDYARRISGLASLPTLQHLLDLANDRDEVKIRIDCLSRLFRVTDWQQRQTLLEELQEFGSTVFSMRHKKTLAEFSSVEIDILLYHPEKFRAPVKQDRNRDTQKARLSSTRSRSRKARENARLLFEIKEELMHSESHATLKMIADRANVRGMRTSRGQEWTPQNVGRTLKSHASVSMTS